MAQTKPWLPFGVRVRLNLYLQLEVSYLGPYRGLRFIATDEFLEKLDTFERSAKCEEIIRWHKARSVFIGKRRFYLLPKSHLQRMLRELKFHLLY